MFPTQFQLNIVEILTNPSGNWADYNSAVHLWEWFNRQAQVGQVDLSLVPPKPDPSDYPNLTGPATIAYTPSLLSLIG